MIEQDYRKFVLTCPCHSCILRPICIQTDTEILISVLPMIECCIFQKWRKKACEIFTGKYPCLCESCIVQTFLYYENFKRYNLNENK
jgi:hypothetical protein